MLGRPTGDQNFSDAFARVSTYTYLKTDEQGNWLTSNSTSVSAGKVTLEYVSERSITYR
ncbi:hypothetical protein [Deinococcus pimensis]|uniref:hypothetical protein n=1 Tax=Deinococcus pimensis TaxID=309888 RepID=UPI0004AD7312|nr:hypothetical protein [Deinococcus pimensis]